MANLLDAEITKYLPFLGNDEKKSLLQTIKSFLNLKRHTNTSQEQRKPGIDYKKYQFPVSNIKFNRDEINER